jgi:hypothetical protein
MGRNVECKGKVNSRRIERNVAALLRLRGVPSKVIPTSSLDACPFDVLTPQGQRIEVKASAYRPLYAGGSGWRFSLHRHGVLDEREVEWYVLWCGPTSTGDFGRNGFYLVLREATACEDVDHHPTKFAQGQIPASECECVPQNCESGSAA